MELSEYHIKMTSFKCWQSQDMSWMDQTPCHLIKHLWWLLANFHTIGYVLELDLYEFEKLNSEQASSKVGSNLKN